MSRVKGRNTRLERDVFRALRREGIHFQKHYVRVTGKPDIAIPSRNIAVFIDSDFWHGWRFPTWSGKLSESWRRKIEDNRRRDRYVTRRLRRKGWKVLRIWEHDLAVDFENVIGRIMDILN